MINESDYLNVDLMNQILLEIGRCDVILRCSNEKYIGMFYDTVFADCPIVICKGECDYNYYLMKAGEMLGIPCVEHKLLVRELFDKVDIGDLVPPEYFRVLGTIYSSLGKYKKKHEGYEEFIQKLNRDLGNQIYSAENDHYKLELRKALRKKKIRQKSYEGDVSSLFEEEFRKLSEKYETKLRAYHNPAYNTDEFYFESFIKDYNLKFWQILFISQDEHKIIIATRHFFKIFDFSEVFVALEVFKAFVDVSNTSFKKIAIDYCEQKKTTPKICEMVEDSIKAILNLNYKELGIEYGFDCDTVICEVYLRPSNSSVMYEILILHNDFLKSSHAFKEAIREPDSIVQKGFFCKKRKFNPEKLMKNFEIANDDNQPIAP